MYGTVARPAVRGIRIARCGRLPVNACPEIFHFIGVTLRALGWRRLVCSGDLVWIAVAGLASSCAERTVNTSRHMGRFFGVAGRALHLNNFVGMRKILDRRVAVGAAQNTVDAGRMFGRIDRDAFAAARRHSRLGVAGETTFVLFEWLRRFRLCLNLTRNQSAD